MFISLVQLYFMSLSTVFSLILCENQGLTINQLRGGCLGACKVPGAPEPPQASPGRVQRLGNGRLTGEQTLCRANLQQYWVPRKPREGEPERVRGSERGRMGARGVNWRRESDHLLVPEGRLQVTVGRGGACQPGFQGAVDPQQGGRSWESPWQETLSASGNGVHINRLLCLQLPDQGGEGAEGGSRLGLGGDDESGSTRELLLASVNTLHEGKSCLRG